MRSATILRAVAVLLASALPLLAAAEETKVIQGMYLSVTGTENEKNTGSPFARLDASPAWSLGSSLCSSYSLRFQTRELSGQVSASASGAAQDDFAISVDQAWIKATFGEGWGIAFGRRELNWKDGGYWNPSDVVNKNQGWDATAPAAGRDSVELIGLLPFRDFNLDVSAATVLSSGLGNPEKLPLYVAAGSILYPLELRAKIAIQDGRQPLVGAAAKLSLSSGELYADGLWLRDHPLAQTFDPFFATPSESRGDWFRYCAGADWTFDTSATEVAETLMIRLEYLRQDDGLSPEQMKAYFDGLAAMPIASSTDQSKYGAAAGLWNGFAWGKDYLVANLALSGIAGAQLHVGITSSCLVNLDDKSLALRNTLSWSPKSLFSIDFTATNYLGSSGSEAMTLPSSAAYSVTLSKSF